MRAELVRSAATPSEAGPDVKVKRGSNSSSTSAAASASTPGNHAGDASPAGRLLELFEPKFRPQHVFTTVRRDGGVLLVSLQIMIPYTVHVTSLNVSSREVTLTTCIPVQYGGAQAGRFFDSVNRGDLKRERSAGFPPRLAHESQADFDAKPSLWKFIGLATPSDLQAYFEAVERSDRLHIGQQTGFNGTFTFPVPQHPSAPSDGSGNVRIMPFAGNQQSRWHVEDNMN